MKIKSIIMHGALTVPGTSINGSTTVGVASKHPGVKLSLMPEGVLVEDNGITALIPMPGIQLIMCEETRPSPKLVNK